MCWLGYVTQIAQLMRFYETYFKLNNKWFDLFTRLVILIVDRFLKKNPFIICPETNVLLTTKTERTNKNWLAADINVLNNYLKLADL